MNVVMKSEAEAAAVINDAEDIWRKTLDIRSRLLRNPYGMVAGAVGAGFVLGGGLFTRLSAKIVGTGLRIGLMVALPILQNEIVKALSTSKLDTNKETEQ